MFHMNLYSVDVYSLHLSTYLILNSYFELRQRYKTMQLATCCLFVSKVQVEILSYKFIYSCFLLYTNGNVFMIITKIIPKIFISTNYFGFL